MSPGRTEHKILVVEDRPEQRDRISAAFALHGKGLALQFSPSRAAAVEAVNRENIDVLFFGGDGAVPDFVRSVLADGQRNTVLIMITGTDDEAARLAAIQSGVDDCVPAGAEGIAGFPDAARRALARRDGERRRAEELDLVIRSQVQWMAILDAITDYIFVIDDQQRLLKVNSAFAAVLQMHPRDVVGKKCSDFFGTEILSECSTKDLEHDGKPRTYEKAIGEETYQISIFPLQEADRSLSIQVMKNITELRRLKDQLHHADKLASIGLLVSGVAHEINNPLTGTIAYTELLTMKVPDESIKRDLNKILESAERCKKIVDNLLTFSRQRTPAKSLESVNDIVDRAIELRGYWLRSSGIEVVKDYDALTTVFVDAQQLQQVILNILLNAEQAIVGAGRNRGRITFTTRYQRADRRIFIRIADNGPGIPQRIISRIFDPFFTTKPVGVGTGLGLSISHGIVSEHGGTIRAENLEEGGAAFIIELPTGAGTLQEGSEQRRSGPHK